MDQICYEADVVVTIRRPSSNVPTNPINIEEPVDLDRGWYVHDDW